MKRARSADAVVVARHIRAVIVEDGPVVPAALDAGHYWIWLWHHVSVTVLYFPEISGRVRWFLGLQMIRYPLYTVSPMLYQMAPPWAATVLVNEIRGIRI
jgi:hypothetical protein